ncbi:MAG TPA: exosortase-dependent surface protein XDP2 [Nostocaceae cyanobacterium]|nr:exosortase-dependent surface protein XDP2 [Nostocaceae cyanobacterium]
MKARNFFIYFGAVLTAVAATTSAAQAASFTSNVSQNTNAKANIFLNSITQNGKTFSNFSYVNRAKILFNTPIDIKDPLNSGAASTDKGDNATAPLPPKADPTNADIVAYLGNNNLNNILDTEDQGSFDIDVFFDSEIVKDNSGLDDIFYWERGQNSDIEIQGLNAAGQLIGNSIKINQTKNSANYAGFQIDTTEVFAPQPVGSWGISLNSLGVSKLSGLRLIGRPAYVGPDFKLIARKTVPEPATVFGLGTVAILAFLRRRQFQSNLSQ